MREFDAKKILVIRLSSLGDVVLTTVLFPNLKARWPQARITVATRAAFAPVFDRNPNVDDVLSLERDAHSFSDLAGRLKREEWDVVFDLHGTLRSWRLRRAAAGKQTVVVDKASFARYLLVYTKTALPRLDRSVRERILNCLRPLDVPTVSTDTQLFPSDPTALFAAHDLTPGVPLIGVAPGARHATKRWPAERFAEAADRLARKQRATVVVLGDRSDETVAKQVQKKITSPCVNLAGKTSMSELIAVTSRLSFLLTNDSGLMHVGEALGIPLVAIFGPTVRAFGFAPYRATSRVVERGLDCRPCTLHGNDKCPLGHHRCMKDIGVEEVLSA